MRLYLIAGEASGDLHGANLLKAIYRQCPDAQCRVWGGDLMSQTGAALVKHYRDLAFMGFAEVLKNLRTILRNIAFCKKDILEFRPDVLVLIDYPGFNLRIARWARAQGIKVVYYIAPQVWAWHASRARAIQRDVDKLLVILPFEREFFAKYGIDAEYTGHPLLDAIDSAAAPRTALRQIALLPGSRKQELSRILPRMLEVTDDFPEYEFVIAAAPAIPASVYNTYLQRYPRVRIVYADTYGVLSSSCAALVKSGTSTLETALFGVPQVVCYAGNSISYFLAKRLVNVQYISLVNLILNRPLVRELIQDELNRNNLKAALTDILTPSRAAEIGAGYAALKDILGNSGASERAARAVLAAAQQP